MRFLAFTINLVLTIFIFHGCRKNPDKSFDYERAAGMWVPYEVSGLGGTVDTFTVTTTSVFGSYAASVQLKADHTYVPVIWMDPNSITFQTPEAGTFTYSFPGKLTFKGGAFTNGIFDFECEIIKLQGDDLWIKIGDYTWKFKRR